MYYWALTLTNLCWNAENPDEKRRLRNATIRKWDNDYLEYYREYINDPQRGEYVTKAVTHSRNLKNLTIEG